MHRNRSLKRTGMRRLQWIAALRSTLNQATMSQAEVLCVTKHYGCPISYKRPGYKFMSAAMAVTMEDLLKQKQNSARLIGLSLTTGNMIRPGNLFISCRKKSGRRHWTSKQDTYFRYIIPSSR